MNNILILAIILIILFFVFQKKIKEKPIHKKPNKITENDENENQKIKIIPEKNYEVLIPCYNLYDEYLKKSYKEVRIPYLKERRTFLKGKMIGKYFGEYLPNKDHHPIFHINIYEGKIYTAINDNCVCINDSKLECNGIHKDFEGEFLNLNQPTIFDKSQLPTEYILILPNDSGNYKIEIKDLKIFNAKYNRSLHQIENKEVFGTVECEILGYVLDYVKDIKVYREYKPDSISESPKPATNAIIDDAHNMAFIPSFSNTSIPLNNLPTTVSEKVSNVEVIKTNNNQHNNKDQKTKNETYKYPIVNKIKNYSSSSNFDISWTFILGILACIFLFILGLKLLIPILCIFLILAFIPIRIWEWMFKLFGIFIGLIFCTSIIWHVSNLITNSISPLINIPKYVIKDSDKNPETVVLKEEPEISNPQDTVLKFHKTWEDYKGLQYSGTYSILKRDYFKSRNHKKELYKSENVGKYNFIVHQIKEFDKDKLDGTYKLFDSIAQTNQLDRMEFASMVISFAQDYNYTLILPEDCNPNLYQDNFIKTYLSENKGVCISNEPFGIMTPIESLVTSKADCDTRTLFIYTILSKYNYDVIMLSSDVYGHSLIGLNLPFTGRNFFKYANDSYALFETTVSSSPPAFISNEISNMNNWYISLKSK